MKFFIPWILVVLVFFSGCGEQKKHGLTPESVNVAFQNWVGYGPFYLACEKGFDKEEGFQLNLVDEQLDSARRDAFQMGMLDAEAATLDLLISKAAQGVPLVAVMETDMSFGSDAIVATENIKTLEDLAGKKVALARDDAGEAFLSSLLYQKGLPLKAITLVPAFPENVAEIFLRNDADACATWEPQVAAALKRPGAHILTSSKDHPGIILDTLNVRKDLLEKNPALVKKLMRVWFRALRYYEEHPLEASTLIAQHYAISPEQYRKQVEGLQWCRYKKQTTDQELQEWTRAAQLLIDVKFANARISKKPDPQTLIVRHLIRELYENRS